MSVLVKIGAAFAASLLMTVQAEEAAAAPGSDIYSPYEFLIGDWTSAPAGQSGPVIRQSFRWGPKRSYILYSTYIRTPGRPDEMHFEGMMVWNGATRALDFLFAVEPGSGIQEQGTIRAGPDQTIVREITLISPDGSRSTFRQTFRQTGPGAAVTSLMRQTATGWAPTFPGSDRLVMTRQPPG